MNVKTARALRDLLSIILAACKDKNLEDMVEIFLKMREGGDQVIVIRFRENCNEK